MAAGGAHIGTVLWLLALPTGTMTLGGFFVFVHELGPKVISGMQHFASGILLAAIAWELAPTIKATSNVDKTAIVVGFIIGAGLLMFVGRYDFKHWFRCYQSKVRQAEAPFTQPINSDANVRDIEVGDFQTNERKEQDAPEVSGRGVPLGLVAAVVLDGSIDGLLIGISYVASPSAGLITSIALLIEMGLLGISTSSTLNKTQLAKWKVLILVFTLPLAIMVAGVIGATVLNALSGAWYIAVVSFGTAGLLYLVTEELMVEAHTEEETDRWYVSGLCFLGFIFVVILSEYVENV